MKPERVLKMSIEAGEGNALIGLGNLGVQLVKQVRINNARNTQVILIDREDELPVIAGSSHCLVLPSGVSGQRVDYPMDSSRTFRKLFRELDEFMQSASFVILVAGLGDDVSSGHIGALSNHFKTLGVPVIGLLMLPDPAVDGRKRHLSARYALNEIEASIPHKILIRLESLRSVVETSPGILNHILAEKLQVLVEILCNPGMMPVDFSRVQQAMDTACNAVIITATAFGKDRAREAAESILSNPDLERYLNNPSYLVVHVLADDDLTLFELDEAASLIAEQWGAEVDMIYGASTDHVNQGAFRLGLILGEQQETDHSVIGSVHPTDYGDRDMFEKNLSTGHIAQM